MVAANDELMMNLLNRLDEAKGLGVNFEISLRILTRLKSEFLGIYLFLNRILMEHLSINALGLGIKYNHQIEVDLEIEKFAKFLCNLFSIYLQH